MGQAIDQNLRPARPFAISFWPGYFVETKAAIFPGMENHFALMFSAKVSPVDAKQFDLMSLPELREPFRQHTVDVVVLGNWTLNNKQWARQEVLRNGYVMTRRIAAAEIYALPADTRR